MSMSFEKLDNGSIVRDENGRVIISCKRGKIAIARFPDMSEEEKSYVAKVYADLTGVKDSHDEVIGFLNYETKEEEFCT